MDLQEVWKISTAAGGRRGAKKGLSLQEAPASSSHSSKEAEFSFKQSASAVPSTSSTSQVDSQQVSFNGFFNLVPILIVIYR